MGERATGRGRQGNGQRGGGEEGARGEGISQMDMIKCLGGHMECLGGMRVQSFLTSFTRATPGTPASYLLGKGSYVFGGVGLSVCLFVDNITQKVMNGLG